MRVTRVAKRVGRKESMIDGEFDGRVLRDGGKFFFGECDRLRTRCALHARLGGSREGKKQVAIELYMTSISVEVSIDQTSRVAPQADSGVSLSLALNATADRSARRTWRQSISSANTGAK